MSGPSFESGTFEYKLSPCSECCLFSFGWFPGVWFIYADVSEHSICSIFKGRCEVKSAYINQTPGNHPKENKQLSNTSQKRYHLGHPARWCHNRVLVRIHLVFLSSPLEWGYSTTTVSTSCIHPHSHFTTALRLIRQLQFKRHIQISQKQHSQTHSRDTRSVSLQTKRIWGRVRVVEIGNNEYSYPTTPNPSQLAHAEVSGASTVKTGRPITQTFACTS